MNLDENNEKFACNTNFNERDGRSDQKVIITPNCKHKCK